MDTPNYVIRDVIRDVLGEDNVCVVYMVVGQCGFVGGKQWHVKGFLDKESADRLCETLNNWCIENRMHVKTAGSRNPYGTHPGMIACGSIASVEEFSGLVRSGGHEMFLHSGAIACGSIWMGNAQNWVAHSGGYTGYMAAKCPLDDKFQPDINGSMYKVEEIPLEA